MLRQARDDRLRPGKLRQGAPQAALPSARLQGEADCHQHLPLQGMLRGRVPEAPVRKGPSLPGQAWCAKSLRVVTTPRLNHPACVCLSAAVADTADPVSFVPMGISSARQLTSVILPPHAELEHAYFGCRGGLACSISTAEGVRRAAQRIGNLRQPRQQQAGCRSACAGNSTAAGIRAGRPRQLTARLSWSETAGASVPKALCDVFMTCPRSRHVCHVLDCADRLLIRH